MSKVILAVLAFGLIAAPVHANDIERERLAIEREKLEMERQRMKWEREREARRLRCGVGDYDCFQKLEAACERLGGIVVDATFRHPMGCEISPEKDECDRAGGKWFKYPGWCGEKAR
jgi:hypothetical protein